MSKLIILQGIPGSGKSTLARKMIFDNPDKKIVRVNRDDIRDMLGEYWVPKREHLVSNIEFRTVEESLTAGYDVILDATNLNDKYITQWLNLAKDFNTEVQFVQVRVSPFTAIRRDWWRGIRGGRRVGAKVILNFYKRYKHKLEL